MLLGLILDLLLGLLLDLLLGLLLGLLLDLLVLENPSALLLLSLARGAESILISLYYLSIRITMSKLFNLAKKDLITGIASFFLGRLTSLYSSRYN